MEAIEKEELEQVNEQSEAVAVSETEAEVTERPEAEDVSAVPAEESVLEVYEEEDIELPPRRNFFHFGRPTREQLLTWIPFGAVLLLGALLRFWNVGDKPLHHDESMHAYF